MEFARKSGEFGLSLDSRRGQPDRLFAAKPLDPPLDGWIAVAELVLEAGAMWGEDITFVPPQRWSLSDVPTQKALRAVHMGGLRRDIALCFENQAFAFMATEWFKTFHRELKHPGKARRGLAFYADWARLREEAEEASPRAPVVWMHQQRPTYSVRSIDAYLTRARNKGLLDGARLTDLGKLILEGGRDGVR